METTITKITKRENKNGTYFLTIYFNYFKNVRFTYLTQKGVRYWKSKGITKFWVGQKISIYPLPKSENFHIFDLEKIKQD